MKRNWINTGARLIIAIPYAAVYGLEKIAGFVSNFADDMYYHLRNSRVVIFKFCEKYLPVWKEKDEK